MYLFIYLYFLKIFFYIFIFIINILIINNDKSLKRKKEKFIKKFKTQNQK
jgi:hypothetical protein